MVLSLTMDNGKIIDPKKTMTLFTKIFLMISFKKCVISEVFLMILTEITLFFNYFIYIKLLYLINVLKIQEFQTFLNRKSAYFQHFPLSVTAVMQKIDNDKNKKAFTF